MWIRFRAAVALLLVSASWGEKKGGGGKGVGGGLFFLCEGKSDGVPVCVCD